MFGMTELLIILGIVLVVFGASRLPKLGKALGETVKEFKKASKDNVRDVEAIEDDEKKNS